MDIEIVKLRLYQGLSEDLRKWFKDGGWDRYNTKGEKVGKCARDDKDGDGKADGPKPKCLPASKAASLGKKKIASAVKRKRSEDPNPNRTGAAKNVKTESVVHEMISTSMSGKKYRNVDNSEDQARIAKENDTAKSAKIKAGKERKKELAATRQTKGIKFYDKKGSGYMKDGKKVYEGTDVKLVKEFVGTTIAGTVGAASAKKKDRVRKAVGTGAGYAIGSTLGQAAGVALGGAAGAAKGAAAVPGAVKGIPLIGKAVTGAASNAGKTLGSAKGHLIGGIGGGAAGAIAGNKLAGETKKKKKTNEETEVRVSDFMEACWKGYEKKGMKTMFGKKYPNCVKKTTKEETELKEFRWDPEGARKAREALPKKDHTIWKPGVDAGLSKDVDIVKNPKGAAVQVAKDKVVKPVVNAVKKGASDAVSGVGNFVKNNPGKAAAIGAGVVGAGLLAKKALGGGKKKEQQESFQSFQEKAQKCWDTHKKVGMKMKGGKLVNDCRPKSEEVEVEEGAIADRMRANLKAKKKDWDDKGEKAKKDGYAALDKVKKTQDDLEKSDYIQNVGESAWQRKEGKNKSGGLNEKGRKSYEAENPGSDLKAPSKKKGNKRRASFCARMKGMRKRQKPSNNTGEDRLSKSLRAWNC